MSFYPFIYTDRGFLPSPDPLGKLPSYLPNIDKFGYELPIHVRSGRARKFLDSIPYFDLPYSKLKEYKSVAELNRLRMLYAYFASAYIHGEEDHVDFIPAPIALPLCALSEIVGRPPILSYADYALNNWMRIDKSKDIELGNIALLQYFNGITDEAWFILVHVDIEAKAGVLLKSMYDLMEFIESKQDYNDDFVAQSLENINATFIKINKTLSRMPEKCHPDVYYKYVRPYIFGFDNIIYNGVGSCSFFGNNKKQSFRGETGAQSSIIPAVLAAFGIKHKDSILTHHLNDMRKYMPRSHRNFIIHMESAEQNVRDFLLKNKVGKHIIKLYNDTLEQLCIFREMHLKYAIDYIQKKCDNPSGTGGTPYVEWLGNLAKETKSFAI